MIKITQDKWRMQINMLVAYYPSVFFICHLDYPWNFFSLAMKDEKLCHISKQYNKQM